LGNLVKPNVERIRLSESAELTDHESQLYIHIKPVLNQLPASAFLRYWKPVTLITLSLSLCYSLVVRPIMTPPPDERSPEISLAALALLPEALQDEELRLDSEDNGATTAVVYSGSEYQKRLQSEGQFKEVPAIVGDPSASSQVISSDFGLEKHILSSGFFRKSIQRPQQAPPSASDDLKSMVKFIAGVIAVNRPNIADCGKVAAAIVKLSAKEHVDPFFIAALISVESRFGQNERSNVGAMGLMQLMPSTAREVADPSMTIKPSLTDVTTNLKLGIDYWKQLEKRYRGNRFLALSAYNWGPGNVDKLKMSPSKIPASVQKYARTILERHQSWLTHFRNAKAGASALG
jgi:hypothetical protein